MYKVFRNGDWVDYTQASKKIHYTFKVLFVGSKSDCHRLVMELTGHENRYPHHRIGDHPQPGENSISNPKHPRPNSYVKETI